MIFLKYGQNIKKVKIYNLIFETAILTLKTIFYLILS